ncbi:hypothetical protein [uncultured Clostridium sp.]|uniref:hypothetical protein n=1 Tax=uncultured Clostridium sp. TaxID=59620 RepID=UPI0025D27189|nr:hypothetical protein [uncultured Clostridium sp.]MDU4882995.1 hypothetical protein [Clostridium celatum]MDU7076104.1 hypothetical protein [Clostridium celatum]
MEEVKRLKMRKLNGQDLFPMLKILSKVKVKDMVLDFLKKRDKLSKSKELTEEETKEIGMEVFADIIDTAMCNLDLAKDEINRLLAILCNVTIDEIQGLGMIEYTTLVMEFFSKEELSDFFKCISSSNAFKNLS